MQLNLQIYWFITIKDELIKVVKKAIILYRIPLTHINLNPIKLAIKTIKSSFQVDISVVTKGQWIP